MENKIDIKMNNGFHLVAEQNKELGFENEIMIYLIDNNNCVYQDLSIVRHSSDGNKFEVLVYADKDNEDYTNKFKIELYKEEE